MFNKPEGNARGKNNGTLTYSTVQHRTLKAETPLRWGYKKVLEA